jgi:hypothetical protein
MIETIEKKKSIMGSIFANSSSPQTHTLSEYSIVPRLNQLIPSDILSKRVEDMSQNELRQVYFNIKGRTGKRLYSSSDISNIENTGDMIGEDINESESMFIGDQVHKAMELNGTNISKLKYYDMIGDAPIIPNNNLNKAELDILSMVCKGYTAIQAHHSIRNNAVTKAVSEKDLHDFIEAYKLDSSTVPSKEISKLIAAAEKDVLSLSDAVVKEYKEYLKKQELYDKRKESLKQPGDIILDDLHFRKMSASRMYNTIKLTYESLQNSQEVMKVYEEGVTGKGEVFTEYVMLWKHQLEDGTMVNCKSMFDRIVVDKEAKIITISDIKTHGKSSKQFVTTNYLSYKYFRSMSFYREAAKYYVNSLGFDANEWKFYMILLPVSTSNYQVGCYYKYSMVSDVDLDCGKIGGYIRPVESYFNIHGQLNAFVSKEEFQIHKNNAILHEGSVQLYRKGWQEIITSYEKSLSVTTAVAA